MITLRRLCLTILAAVVTVAAAACGSTQAALAPPPLAKKGDGLKVVAGSTWEAGFAKAAGATDITVIMPPGVHDLAGYTPAPFDLIKVAEADVVLYAPSEGFADALRKAAKPGAKVVEVSLNNSPAKVKAEVLRLGEEFGTTETATAWTMIFDIEYEALKNRVARVARRARPVTIAEEAVAWATDLIGVHPAAVYGPQTLTPKQISSLISIRPRLVLDNASMPGGNILAGMRATRVVLENFPDQRLDLMAVYRANANAIVAALR